jgi:hypothetical protein
LNGGVSFAPLAPGRLRAHFDERESRLALESSPTAVAGTVYLEPPSRVAARLEAADGAWDVRRVEAVPRHHKAHLAVEDTSGATVATVWPQGAVARLDVPGGSVVWQAPSLSRGRLFRYRIEGLLVARPAWTTLGKGRPGRHPFTAEVTSALVARPDASLVLLLAAWLTWHSIDTAAA